MKESRLAAEREADRARNILLRNAREKNPIEGEGVKGLHCQEWTL